VSQGLLLSLLLEACDEQTHSGISVYWPTPQCFRRGSERSCRQTRRADHGEAGEAPAPASAVNHENPATAPLPAVKEAVAPSSASPVSLPPKFGIRTVPVRRPSEKITVELPDYLAAALRREGLERRTTARTLVIMGLKALGFEVEDQDLVPDGRRARPKRSS